MNKNNKFTALPFSVFVLFLCLGLTLSLYSLFRPARSFSERENRMLKTLPGFSLQALIDGSFADGVEDAFSDQFVGRDLWTSLNLMIKRITGQQENGGVYLGKNGQMYLIPEPADEAGMKRNLDAVNAFAEQFPEVRSCFCVVPNAVCVQPQNLPAGAPVPDQRALIDGIGGRLSDRITFVDVCDCLAQHSEEYLYYRTDHHWTSLGARTAFAKISEAMGIEGEMQYKTQTVPDAFYGTLSSKSGSRGAKDAVELYLPETDVIYYVSYNDGSEKASSMYVPDAMSSGDQYAVFFGGNHPRVDLVTTADTGRKLLVFKDSYFNCLAQFLWPHFDSIIVIDPRYYYESAADIIRQEGITDVLYLYNADTFGTDHSLYAVLS